VRVAHLAGLTQIGENYAQELIAKATELESLGLEWHAIGQLQSNKIRPLAAHVGLWQSVDRLKIGRRIAEHQPGAEVLVQLQPRDVPADGPKGGCRPEDAAQLVSDLRALGLVVSGVMTVGVNGDRQGSIRAFADARSLADEFDLPHRSYGMSGDLEDAVDQGSTMVRLGTALFGARPPRIPQPRATA